MKRFTTWIGIIVFPSIILTFSSCQKEANSKNASEETAMSSGKSGPVIRAYRDSFVNHLMFAPDIAGGWTTPNISPAWYPGEGSGHATHMGNASMYFNQYANESNIVAAPVAMFFTSQLAAAGYGEIPPAVSTIIFDDKGNSIWFHHTSILTTPVSPTKVNVLGEQDIVGGTGKFSEATGHVTLNAFFNPQNLQESSSWQDGWIRY